MDESSGLSNERAADAASGEGIKIYSLGDLAGITTGNRVPEKYFWTSGSGESNEQVHAGSYHQALTDAGIERFNIMSYSSIIPEIAREVRRPINYTHGAVLEAITATASTDRDYQKGDPLTAAILVGWLKKPGTRNHKGGLVCEYNGNLPVEEVKASLQRSLAELYETGPYSMEKIDLEPETEFKVVSFVPEKKFGTALVAIGFTSYFHPVIGVKEKKKRSVS